MDEQYYIKKLESNRKIQVEVPGSKSITNRALLLAALSNCRCVLKNVMFSDDSRAFLSCLKELGFELLINEKRKEVMIQGTAGRIPKRKASIHVRSAGTAARFLTVMLAFAGGEYELDASEQMKKRPMKPVLDVIKKAGCEIIYREEEGHFPFIIRSEHICLKSTEIETGTSSQFASALLMAGVMLPEGLTVALKGGRAEGAYIKMTLSMMRQFGIQIQKEGNSCRIPYDDSFGVEEYLIEPDLSGACYFYALAPVIKTDVIVKNVYMNSIQGDLQFIKSLSEIGCDLEETREGILLKGKGIAGYKGICIDMMDFSDQTMTMAAVAAFASSPTIIQNIGHIRFQESDRITAVITELNRIGIFCEELKETDGIRIIPGNIREALIETYHDHRMAMAFTIIGLASGKLTILNPGCCAKTFENYFEIVESLYGN